MVILVILIWTVYIWKILIPKMIFIKYIAETLSYLCSNSEVTASELQMLWHLKPLNLIKFHIFQLRILKI